MSTLDLSTLQDKQKHVEAGTEFNAPTTAKQLYWKGDHAKCEHHRGVCSARAGWTNSASGAVVPQIAPLPDGKRFRVTVEDESPNSSGDVVMGWAAKGWIKLEREHAGMKAQKSQQARLIAEIVSEIRPDEEIVSVLRDLIGREHTSTREAKNVTADIIEKEVAAIHVKFDKANAAPSKPAQGTLRG